MPCLFPRPVYQGGTMFQLFTINDRELAIVTDQKLPRKLRDATSLPRWPYTAYILSWIALGPVVALFTWIITSVLNIAEQSKTGLTVLAAVLALVIGAMYTITSIKEFRDQRQRIRSGLYSQKYEGWAWDWAIMPTSDSILKAIRPMLNSPDPTVKEVILDYVKEALGARKRHDFFYRPPREYGVTGLDARLAYELEILDLAEKYQASLTQSSQHNVAVFEANLRLQRTHVRQEWQERVESHRASLMTNIQKLNDELTDIDERIAADEQ